MATRARLPAGASKLRSFLKANGLTQAAAAKALGVTDVAVHEWVTGTRRPRPELRHAIATWTNGAVPVEIWESAAERRAMAQVQPFVPPKAANGD